MRGLKAIRIGLWVCVVAVALISGATYLLSTRGPAAVATGFGGGTYALIDQTGSSVDQTLFVGHPSLLFFGFTHCPEVCPTTLAEMTVWFETLGEDGKDLRAYLITVDPERDTAEVLGDYVGAFSDRITALTGQPAEIAKITAAWGVYAAKVPTEGGDYTMDHTATVFMLNAKGEFEGTIAFKEDADTAITKLRRLLGKS